MPQKNDLSVIKAVNKKTLLQQNLPFLKMKIELEENLNL